MDVTRRELLAGMGGLLAAAACRRSGRASPAPATVPPLGDVLRSRRLRDSPGQTWLNSAFIHPIPVAAANAVRSYLETRTFREPRLRSGDSLAAEVKAEFAALVNAKPSEISLVQSTSVAENLVVSGLGLPAGKGSVVTDALHFDGSLVLYGELAQAWGGPHHRAATRLAHRPRRLRAGRGGDTRLVAISLVSWYNGFQHDLKAVCDIAHAKGAHVYADVIQAAGNTPIDVRTTGVDFLACSTFKWLMGDFGIGFLYVREDLLERVVRRTQVGYGEADEVLHYLPSDPPGGHAGHLDPAHGRRRALRGRDVRPGRRQRPLRLAPLAAAARPREDPGPPSPAAGAAARGDASTRLHLDHAA